MNVDHKQNWVVDNLYCQTCPGEMLDRLSRKSYQYNYSRHCKTEVVLQVVVNNCYESYYFVKGH